MKLPFIDSITIDSDNYMTVNKILTQKEFYPNELKINLSDNMKSKSSVLFNVLPNKDVKEDITIKKYILSKRYIEAVFDRNYQSTMRQSPNHLIFLSSLVQLQKMIYVYLCYEFGLSINLKGDEQLKVWPTNLNINMPEMITKNKNISQKIHINSLRKTGNKTYFGKCESTIDDIVSITADALVYII